MWLSRFAAVVVASFVMIWLLLLLLLLFLLAPLQLLLWLMLLLQGKANPSEAISSMRFSVLLTLPPDL